MKKKILNMVILSAIVLNTAAISVSAIDRQNPYKINTSENGITYELWSDGSFTSNTVKDLTTNSKSIKIPSFIKYENETFEIDTLAFLEDDNVYKKPKCAKTCEKLTMNNADVFMGIAKWNKLKEIKAIRIHTYFGHIKNCKKLQKLFVSGCTDFDLTIGDISNNKSLKTITLKNIYKIEPNAVYNCKKLKTVILSSNVENIETKAFNKCFNLSKVIIKSKNNVPEVKEKAFKNTKKGIKFYVKNKKVAKSLNKQLKGSGVRNAKILIGKKVVYKNVK